MDLHRCNVHDFWNPSWGNGHLEFVVSQFKPFFETAAALQQIKTGPS
jgi:hypothetical protein